MWGKAAVQVKYTWEPDPVMCGFCCRFLVGSGWVMAGNSWCGLQCGIQLGSGLRPIIAR